MEKGVVYDEAHDYRSQLLGLLLAEPLLADEVLVVVDDANFPAVRQATWDFLAARPQARLLLELYTPGNCHPGFWNGLLAPGWEKQRCDGAGKAFLRRRRERALLTSLHPLQRIDVRIEGDRLVVTRND